MLLRCIGKLASYKATKPLPGATTRTRLANWIPREQRRKTLLGELGIFETTAAVSGESETTCSNALFTAHLTNFLFA